MMDDYVVEMLGCVRGLSLLDICCACDAKQAFSWANLGAAVTACDISPTAIEIARSNAEHIGQATEFISGGKPDLLSSASLSYRCRRA